MSLKDEYKVGQRVWFQYFGSSEFSPFETDDPREYEITVVTNSTMKLKSVAIDNAVEWTANSYVVNRRVWRSLAHFYQGQSFYFRREAARCTDAADEAETKLAAEMYKGYNNNDAE
jgi:hypothetical protein